MLQVKNVSITHRKDLKEIIKEVSFVCNPKDKAVIIGEEGNGKSTFLKWIYDEALLEDYAYASGEKILNQEILGYLPQELPKQERKKTVYEYFMEEEEFMLLSPKELGKMAMDFRVNVDFFYRDQLMESLSGGEKIKTQMLRLLLQRPTVLLLDEPTNDIDLDTLHWMEDFICRWPYIVLYVSHDEMFIEHTANMIIHFEQIQRKTKSRYSVVHQTYAEYKKQRRIYFESQRKRVVTEQKEKKIRDEKYRKIQQKVEHQQNTVSRQDPHGGQLLKKKMHTVKAMERRFSKEEEAMTKHPEEEEAIYFKLGDESIALSNSKTVLSFSLDFLYSKDHSRILSHDISLNIRGNQKVCIVGKNGIGKTTLLHLIYENLKERTDLNVEYMPQNYEELLDLKSTPVEFLCKSKEKEEQTKIQTYLGALKFTYDEMQHAIEELSGGQKAKIFLLKMSLSKANVLILDEPTRNFSPLSAPFIRDMLAGFLGCIISISHDRIYMNEVCDTLYELTESGLFPYEQEQNADI